MNICNHNLQAFQKRLFSEILFFSESDLSRRTIILFQLLYHGKKPRIGTKVYDRIRLRGNKVQNSDISAIETPPPPKNNIEKMSEYRENYLAIGIMSLLHPNTSGFNRFKYDTTGTDVQSKM